MDPGPAGGTRERILEMAEASLGERGYHGTRLHQIAERVGIQKASLFHYFPSKDALYRAVVDVGFGETDRTIRRVLEAEGNPLEKLRRLIEAYVDMVAAHPARTRIFLRQSLGDTPVGHRAPDSERLLGMVVQFIVDGQQAKIFAPVDAAALVLGVVGMVAFFLTSAPVIAPTSFGDPARGATVQRVKRHVTQVVQRCLTVGEPARNRSAQAAVA
jgi:AcrR family transcriptional regulator